VPEYRADIVDPAAILGAGAVRVDVVHDGEFPRPVRQVRFAVFRGAATGSVWLEAEIRTDRPRSRVIGRDPLGALIAWRAA
jgi:hypothetical protein